MNLEQAYEEKLSLHSRENEKEIICDHCKEDPNECGYDYLFCEQCAKEWYDEEVRDDGM